MTLQLRCIPLLEDVAHHLCAIETGRSGWGGQSDDLNSIRLGCEGILEICKVQVFHFFIVAKNHYPIKQD